LNLIQGNSTKRGVEERGQAWRWRPRTVLDRCITDAGYRGHNAPPDHKFKVYTSGQKRRVTPQIKREFKRHAARNYRAHARGDAINAVLAAAGYNFRRLVA
jgi:transposase, IS5 family